MGAGFLLGKSKRHTIGAILALLLAAGIYWASRSPQSHSKAVRDARTEPLLGSLAQSSLSESAFPHRGQMSTQSTRHHPSAVPPTRQEIESLIEKVSWQDWYGLYLAEKKIGAARMTLRKTRPGEIGAFLIASDVLMRPAGDGSELAVLMTDVRHYSGESPFALVFYESLDSSTGRHIQERFGTQGTVEVKDNDGAPSTQHVIASSEENLQFAFSSWLAAPDMAHRTLRSKEFDPNTLRDSEVEVIPVEEKVVPYGDGKEKVLVSDIFRSIDNSTTRQHVNGTGRLLYETMSNGFSLRLEEKKRALQFQSSVPAPLR